LRGEQKTLVRKRSKGTELDVFSDREGRANAAIIDALAKESPQTIKQILKKITKYEGLEETYYASLTKRLRNLTETGLIEEIKPNQKGTPTRYRLCVKAILAMVLEENCMQDIFNQATQKEAAHILLAVLNVLLTKKDQDK
jgi:DNA-binding HxlR family transcriptional regulator